MVERTYQKERDHHKPCQGGLDEGGLGEGGLDKGEPNQGGTAAPRCRLRPE
ncbi:hypothetical protein [Sphingorhabdus sp. Alg231-15]|uniref:hypothetical protein n=1 Tax=Sphingorhabdus sp. Alg231-15 TaxID=1922222 RepID=UPI00307BD925